MSLRSFICLIDDSIVQDMSRFMWHHTTSVSASVSVKPVDNFNKTFSGPHRETENWTSNIATLRNAISTCQGFAGTYKANMRSHCWFSVIFILHRVNVSCSYFVTRRCSVWANPGCSTWCSDREVKASGSLPFALQHALSPSRPRRWVICTVKVIHQRERGRAGDRGGRGTEGEWWRREALSVGFPCQFFCQEQ